jgi:hypothetical protein
MNNRTAWITATALFLAIVGAFLYKKKTVAPIASNNAVVDKINPPASAPIPQPKQEPQPIKVEPKVEQKAPTDWNAEWERERQ